MLQILSTSNETSTGPELVQNGNFSEVGSELITNGDFSATGSELLPEGASPMSGTWGGTGVIVDGKLEKNGMGIAYLSITNTPGKSYKAIVDVESLDGNTTFWLAGTNSAPLVVGINTIYIVAGNLTSFGAAINDGYTSDEGSVINSISVKELGEDWTLETGWSIEEDKASVDAVSTVLLSQSSLSVVTGKSYKISLEVSNIAVGSELQIEFSASNIVGNVTTNGEFTFYGEWGSAPILYLYSLGTSQFSVSNVTLKEVGQDWTIGTGWSIGANKAISAVTGSNSDITQSILTAGKTYQTIFEVVDYTAGTVQAVVTGDVGADRTAIETYTESLTATGTNFSIRSKLGTFNGSVSSVSVKLLGAYDAQSIYVTAADVQTIAQASVYYLVELTSMASKNSLYFLPSSVVPNNGRYTKLNFTVISKDATPTPASGIIS